MRFQGPAGVRLAARFIQAMITPAPCSRASALMALGGLVSLSDRRYRVAAGARRAHGHAQPAE